YNQRDDATRVERPDANYIKGRCECECRQQREFLQLSIGGTSSVCCCLVDGKRLPQTPRTSLIPLLRLLQHQKTHREPPRSALPPFMKDKGLLTGSKGSNICMNTKPKFALPSTAPKSSKRSFQFGQPDSSWAASGLAIPVGFQGSQTSKPPPPTTTPTKPASQVRKKAP
ncbi:hypothetical protein E8E11_003529, partial [Didymella keratinophila]